MRKSNQKFRNSKEEVFDKTVSEKVGYPNSKTKNVKERRSGNRRGSGKRDPGNRVGSTQPTFVGSNDVRWYARSEQLLSNVGRLSFNYPAGTDIPYQLGHEAGYANTKVGAGVWINPGIMSVGLIPTYGISVDSSSPLNVAAKQIYNRIRMENSGARNYDHTDLIKYLIGVDSLFMYYAWMIRAYGLINNFNFHNKYLPKSLIFATGIDYNDIMINRPLFLNYINNYAKRLTAYLAPKDMPIFERHFTMFSSIYKDSESGRSQFYLYTPAILWLYDSVATPGTPCFHARSVYNYSATEGTCAGLTFQQIVTLGNELLGAMDDEDMVTMAGDILKAYGEGGIWTQTPLAPDYVVEPIFDFSWLPQVQNLCSLNINSCGAVVTNGAMDPTNVNYGTVYNISEIVPSNTVSPYMRTSMSFNTTHGPFTKHKKLLSSPFHEPTPGDVMESTRLMFSGDATAGTGTTWAVTINSCGSEVVANVHVVQFIGSGTTNMIGRRPLITEMWSVAGNTVNELTLFQNLVDLDNFAMHPTVYFTQYGTGTGDALDITKQTLSVPFVDLDNYALISDPEIENLHYEALLSLLFSGNVGGGRAF